MATIKAIAAAATSYEYTPWGTTLSGPLGAVYFPDDSAKAHEVPRLENGYTDPEYLRRAQRLVSRHPVFTGVPVFTATEEMVPVEHPDGGERKITVMTRWDGDTQVINHGYRAGGVWVDQWLS